MVAFAFEWTKTLPGPLALASLEHKLLFWVDTVGGVRLAWAGGQDRPVTGALTSPCSPDHPAAAGEDGAGSCPESLSCGPCRWGGPSTALGEARAMDRWTDARTVGWLGGQGRAAPRGRSYTRWGGGAGGDSLSLFPLPSASSALPSASLASVPHTLVLEAGSCKWGCFSAPSACLACRFVSPCVCSACLSAPSPTSSQL